MKAKRLSVAAAVTAIALAGGSAHAAVVVLDTFFPGDVSTFPSVQIGRNDQEQNFQGQAQPFAINAATTISDVLTAMHGGVGSVTLGVEAAISSGSVLVPSNSFLFSTTVTPSSNALSNVDASGLNWTLPAGQYFLVALPAANGTSQFWASGENGGNAPFGIFMTNTQWIYSDSGPRAVRIEAVPEPSSYALMLGGLGVIGWAARRRSVQDRRADAAQRRDVC